MERMQNTLLVQTLHTRKRVASYLFQWVQLFYFILFFLSFYPENENIAKSKNINIIEQDSNQRPLDLQ